MIFTHHIFDTPEWLARQIEMPDPTPEMLEDPLFENIWSVIKTWDINVPNAYHGYMGANGSHAAMIYNNIKKGKANDE